MILFQVGQHYIRSALEILDELEQTGLLACGEFHNSVSLQWAVSRAYSISERSG